MRRREVVFEGTVGVLWEPGRPKIQQVGLVEDETGRIEFTAWRYDGRVSVALTGWSSVVFPTRN